MEHIYKTKGTCSSVIKVSLDENGIIKEVYFMGGCDGNLSGISKLVKGKPAQEIINLLRGNRCGMRSTSCPDQLTYALEEALKKS